MLGKGLESLIPPNNKGGDGAGHIPVSSNVPPQLDPARDLPEDPQPFFLEPAPLEDELDMPASSSFLPADDATSDDTPARSLDGEEEVAEEKENNTIGGQPSPAREEIVNSSAVKEESKNKEAVDAFSSVAQSDSAARSTTSMRQSPASTTPKFGPVSRSATSLPEGFSAAAHVAAKKGSAHASQIPHGIEAKPYEAVFHIETDKIKPNPQQPRRNFDENAIKELAASIREFGILQPLVVTKHEYETEHGTGVEYYLIAGERRLLASKYLGLERVPAVIRQVDLPQERLELAIIENLQRENLNPVEMARAFARLQDEFRLTQREIAVRLGKSREVVANTMRLLDLPPYIMEAVETGRITESHGRLLLAVTDPRAQEKLFYDLTARNMSVRELKNRVDEFKQTSRATPAEEISPEMAALQARLSQELGTPVKIQKGKEGGKITISFYSEEELQGLLAKLDKGRDGLGY